MIIPALTQDYLDAAALDLASNPPAPALTASIDAEETGLQTSQNSLSKKAAWAAAPKWLTHIRSQVKKMLVQPALSDRDRGESSKAQKMAALAKLGQPIVMAPFATVLMRWQLDFKKGSKLANDLSSAAIGHYEAFIAKKGAGRSPRALNNDFFDYQVGGSQ